MFAAKRCPDGEQTYGLDGLPPPNMLLDTSDDGLRPNLDVAVQAG